MVLFRRHNGRNRVLEDQLFLMVRLENHAVLVKSPHASRKLHAAGEINRDRNPFFTSIVEETVLQVLTGHIAPRTILGTLLDELFPKRRGVKKSAIATRNRHPVNAMSL